MKIGEIRFLPIVWGDSMCEGECVFGAEDGVHKHWAITRRNGFVRKESERGGQALIIYIQRCESCF